MASSALLGAGVRRAVSAAGLLTRPFIGPPPVNDRGVALDVGIHVMLRLIEASGRPTLDQLGPARARVEMRRLSELLDLPHQRLPRVVDRVIEGPESELTLRVYTPRTGPGPLPCLVYFHGGGFVIGDLESHDRVCRFIARRAGVTVIAVDYRLAPENPFPAGVEDSVAAFRWVAAHAGELGVDPDRLAVGGDSAGGNLAAVVCQQLEPEERPAFQLLIYPSTDLGRSCESHRLFAEGFFLTESLIDWFVANYLTSAEQERDPRGSPLVTADLSGLPPAHVVVAGFDPLRDEGEAYARHLMASGVPCSLRCYGSLIHGFFSSGGVNQASRMAIEDIADVLRERLWGRGGSGRS